ncbi:streptococcal hemagglutinin [Procambarus clarkii]|uniref:streptococcal hemagglutinin n=1 Tax=Procambarus clarkii TaxID=6728 RepID=UPI0037449A52
MRALILAVAVVCCAARPTKRETRTDYAFPPSRDPPVVTILRSSVPQINALTTAASHAPLIKVTPAIQDTVTVLEAADPVVAAAPVVVAAAPEPLLAPDPPLPSVGKPFVGGQFHAQDEAGQYSFAHWGGPSTRVETRDFLGRTYGSFAYVNPDGDVEVRKYGASPATGFRVAASDLPVDTPKVAQSESLAFIVSEPDATLKANPVQDAATIQDAVPIKVSAPDPVATVFHKTKTTLPVQYGLTASVATESHSVELTPSVQYTDLAPLTTEVQTIRLATPVTYVAPAPVITNVEVETPVEYASSADVASGVEVAAPVAGVAPAPVIVAAAPEPLLAPDPPLPSVGEPYVGGQFHAQDEAGQYSFGHWGGSSTRVETRDFLGRTYGSFAYVNPDGDVEVRKYSASPATGFRVAASDLPTDTPKVAQSENLVFTISEPDVTLKASTSAHDIASKRASASVALVTPDTATTDVATEVKTVQVLTPVQYASTQIFVPEEAAIKIQTVTPVQYIDQGEKVAYPVESGASSTVAAKLQLFTPVESANVAVVATENEVDTPVAVASPAPGLVATPVQHSAPAVVVAPAPVVVAAAPEPLLAPDPPLPSVGKPFVGGQFHAQDEAGQYSFAHWGGPSTRVETRDFLGRTYGSFAYVNPDGDVEVRKYGASPATGFRVAASDLPVDTPKVAQSESLAFIVSEPDATLKANPVQDAATIQDAVPIKVSAPDPVATVFHKTKTTLPVQYGLAASVATESHSVELTPSVQYTDLAPLTTEVQTIRLATPVTYVAPAPVITNVEVEIPVEYASSADVASGVEVAAPVAGVAPAPVIVAAAPEPLLAPDPPLPSVGEPYVGGQFHAQDEAGQYSFGHWGGSSTRVETRDFLGRTYGSFAYVNPDGDVEVRKYSASPATGFRVAASDLPTDTPKVAQSENLVFTISEPDVTLKASTSAHDIASTRASASVALVTPDTATTDVATEVKTVQVLTPVQYASTQIFVPEEAAIMIQTVTPVQYIDQGEKVAYPVESGASSTVAAKLQLFTPVESANVAVVATEDEVDTPVAVASPAPGLVATPVQHSAPAVVVAPAPVVVAAAPEPLFAPDPPLPSVGKPFVGGQFHAQDEAGQYSFAHWGGPSTRVETRDFLGRTYGSFAYVNPDGDVEVRKYGASPSTGFRVAASDLPVDTPKVAQSESLAFIVSEPDVTLKANPVQDAATIQDAVPIKVSAPDPVATVFHKTKTTLPVQYGLAASVATESHSVEPTPSVQYTDLAPLTTEVQTIRLATPVTYVAPAPVTTNVEVETPVEYASSADVASGVEVAAPVAGVAPAPVIVAAAPEPLLAPDPPLPSVGEPYVGGQFHAQDEAGQYSFGHWGGSSTRVETRDFLGRTYGSFAYVNPDGDVEVRKYSASPATGFRVAASDLPTDTPKVAQSENLVFLISEPDVTLKASTSAHDIASTRASASVALVTPDIATTDVATEVKTVQVLTPVQYASTQIYVPEEAAIKIQTVTPVQYIDQGVEVTYPVESGASSTVAAKLQLFTPVESANVAVVATENEVDTPVAVASPAPGLVATPVQHSAPAAVVAPAPVVVAAAPEPLFAPDPPLPSVGKPFVGGQFHAQDEAGQYSFAHWGGPSTRVETRDFLGRTYGSFAYVNPDGDVEVRKYGASPSTGFRVAASDLPTDTPKVAQSENLVFTISEPDVTLKASTSAHDIASTRASASVALVTPDIATTDVATEVKTVQVLTPVQYASISTA